MPRQIANALGIALAIGLFVALLVAMATLGEITPNELSCVQAPYQTKCPKSGGDN